MEEVVPPAIKLTLVGFRVAVMSGRETVAVRLTLPTKPLRLVTLTLATSDRPPGIGGRGFGMTMMPKS